MSTAKGPRPSVLEGYIPCGDEEIDGYIKSAVEDFYATLTNGKRSEYRSADIKERLAIACWKWGESGDADLQARSKQLKTKQLIRSMARVMLAGDPEQSETKHLPMLNDYWKEVDENFRGEIDEFARRQDGKIIPYHLDFIGDSDNTFAPMIEVNDFRIYGKFLVRNNLYLHAEYRAQHTSVPLED